MKNLNFRLKSTIVLIALLTVNITIQANPMGKGNPVEKQMNQAKKKGKAVFVLITGTGVVGVDKATQIANEAKAKYAKSEVVIINKDDAVNSELVAKYGIGKVNVPFFLVVSPKGIPVAGFMLSQATPEVLVNAVPSPKQDEVFISFSEKKPVFIVISKKGFADKSTVVENCKSASSKITSKPYVVQIDFEDTKESAFLKKLKVTAINGKTITLVLNATGQVNDQFEGIVLETSLIASANKVAKRGGCCPSGSKSGCGGPK
jgi:uncharacterized membrane protein